MNSPPAVLRAGALAHTSVTGNASAAVDRCAQLGATHGPQTLVHQSTAAGAQALDEAWDAIRANGVPPDATDRLIILIAPPPGDPHAEAARAGLENLARTLSIEWSRYGTRVVTILPGTRTTEAEVGELVAYLASKAGAYFAGCAFTLR